MKQIYIFSFFLISLIINSESVGANSNFVISAAQDVKSLKANEPTVNFYKEWRKSNPDLPKLELLPPTRLIINFKNLKNYCAFGWGITTLMSLSSQKFPPLIESSFFRNNFVFVLEQPGLSKVKTFADLDGKDIYTPYKNEFQALLKKYIKIYKITISKAPNYDSLTKMYKNKRANYIMYETPQQIELFQKLDLVVPKLEDRLVTFVSNDGMTCIKTKKSRKLIDNFNSFIAKTRKDGRYFKILGNLAYKKKKSK